MNRKQGVPSAQHAVIPKPALAMVVRPNGQARRRAGVEPGSSRAERIREVAYQLYEARGRADGHDIADWLAAEAAVDGRTA